MNRKSGESCLGVLFSLFAAVGFFICLIIAIVAGVALFENGKQDQKEPAEIVFEEPITEEPPAPPYDTIEPGECLYYITYAYDGLIRGSTNIIMDRSVSDWAAIYGTNSLLSRLLDSENEELKKQDIVIVNFQCIAYKKLP